MRITIVQGPYFPVPPAMGGAVEKVWFQLGKEFVKRGHEVIHISRSFRDWPASEFIEGVKHIRVPSRNAPGSRALFLFFDAVYALRVLSKLPNADIVVTNSISLPLLIRSSGYGALYVHVARYPKGQMKYYSHATRLQAVSSAVRGAILAESPELADKTAVIPNPLPHVTPSRDVSLNAKSRNKSVLYVGRIHPEKGVELLLNGFRLFTESAYPEWELIVVGPWELRYGGGGEGYISKLKKLGESLQIRVNWLGAIFEHDRLAEIYRQAGIFVYPSLAEKGESFGLAPLEAMSYGCPVVVSDLACFRDYLRDGENGLVFDHRASSPECKLALALSRLLDMAESGQLKTMAISAYETAKKHSIDSIAEQYLRDFCTLLPGENEIITKH